MAVHVKLPTLHADQARAFRLKSDARGGEWDRNEGGRFKAIRCGRRWGKTLFGETWIADGAIKGEECGWFAPAYKYTAEVYHDLKEMLEPVTVSSSKTDGVIRTRGGGRVDIWTLENEDAGRSRRYKRVFIDESAFTNANMMDVWKRSITPTLLDYSGRAMTASNTNGVNPDNFLWQVCNQPEHGFIEYHAPSINNPVVPMRRGMRGHNSGEWVWLETEAEHAARRLAEFEAIRDREHPLVFAQEYLADFVDWSGVAFFSLEKMLVNDQPVPYPTRCDGVFAVIDSATKTGTANDGTAVTYYARTKFGTGHPLLILDWDIIQIEGALLDTWLPTVFQNLEALSIQCGARSGALGVHIEDKSSGMVLLQQAARRNLDVYPIDSGLTAVGKDERAISVSGYVYRGMVKLSSVAYDKVVMYKGTSRNHFVSQVTGFRIGDKDAAKRADDLLDTFTYGIALSLGDSEGF